MDISPRPIYSLRSAQLHFYVIRNEPASFWKIHPDGCISMHSLVQSRVLSFFLHREKL